MVLPFLIIIVILFGIIIGYIYFLAPRFNPLNKANNYIKQNMIEEAIVEYKRILDKNPKNFVVHYKLADIYFDRNEIDQGIYHLEEIIRINSYNYEVEKITVARRLAQAYLSRNEIERAFQNYIDILKIYSGDVEALYQISFITLGQEYFDYAQRYFDRLANQSKKSFEVLFGAGIASYQNQKTNNAIAYFKDALAVEPHSDIANLAMAFAQQRKKDFKTAINYAKMIVDNSTDQNAVFIAKRCLGIVYVQAKRGKDAVKVFEELLDYAKKNDMPDEVSVILYDLGFASINAEMTEQAYEYWNQLYLLEPGYRNVKSLITKLRKEMDVDVRQKSADSEMSVIDYTNDWITDSFPENYIWDICGLKSETMLDIKSILASAKVEREHAADMDSGARAIYDSDILDRFSNIDAEKFRIISNRVVSKLGYSVDDILTTYRESDGVDFLARYLETNEKTLIWVRRWKGTNVGEIPLRNFAQAINDIKAKSGLFITSSDLTPSAEIAVKRLSKVTVILPEQLADYLVGLL